MNTTLKRNGLSLIPQTNGFICQDLAEIPKSFEARFSQEEVKGFIAELIGSVRSKTKKRLTTEGETSRHSEEELVRLGQEIFDEVVAQAEEQTSHLNLFEKTLFWLGNWWYYNPVLMRTTIQDRSPIWAKQNELAQKIIPPVLPEPVRRATEGMSLRSVSVDFGHFAALFCDGNGTRRIVTDTALYELHGVEGYSYLDIGPDGKPFTRSRCQRGGGRAFFDGLRLMSHAQFETCAPKTIFIEGGYKVNSTKCTIVDGKLFNLIDVDDAVAHTTGAFMGCCDFSTIQLADSVELAEKSAKQIRIKDGTVQLNEEALKPTGIFMPSSVRLLENGFTLYDWSDFHEIESIRYKSVLVVDDNQTWIDSMLSEFGEDVEELSSFQTHSADNALAKILEINPDAVVLDIHLTEGERFEGLWVANQLATSGFKGLIMIASSYGDEHLQAMQRLIKTQTVPTGKHLGRIRKVLTGKKQF